MELLQIYKIETQGHVRYFRASGKILGLYRSGHSAFDNMQEYQSRGLSLSWVQSSR